MLIRQCCLRKCSLNCQGYKDHELKELKDGRIVKIVSCHHCFRILSRVYYKKEKPHAIGHP